MANRNNRRRRNRGGGGSTLPGPSAFLAPWKAKDSTDLYVQVKKPGGLPAHLTPTHYSVTLKGAPDQMLLHGSRCANTWTTGKIPVDTWQDMVIQVSSASKVSMTSTVWYSAQ